MSEYLGFEPTTENNYYFVSYNSDDSERLTGLLTLLSQSGLPLWYDYGLKYGNEKEWRTQIGEKIDNCQSMIVFVTKNLFSKPDTYVRIEYEIAKNKCNKDIYAIILESIVNSDVPFSMYDWWVDIQKYHHIEAWKYSDAVGVIEEIYRMLSERFTQSVEKSIRSKSEEVTALLKSTLYEKSISEHTYDLYQACDMLIKLEDSYQSNPRHIFVYNQLDQEYRDGSFFANFTGNSVEKEGINNCDIVQYFTFFESLYRAIKNNILMIEDVDDCFADRFFKFIHHPYIQENELYLVPSTYANIFELYAIWKKYHLISLSSPSKISTFLDNEIPDLYFDKKLYMQDIWDIRKRDQFERRFRFVNLSQHSSASGYKEFELKRLFPRNLRQVVKLQNDIVSELENKDLFVESTKQEFLESMLIDFCYGLFDGDILASICVIVLNRDAEDRNMIMDFGKKITESRGIQSSYIDCLTFDTIQVSKEYRGYGIQKFFLSLAENLCAMMNAKIIMASVSPMNTHSKKNFLKFGYNVLTTKKMTKGIYNNRKRNIMIKYISDYQ